MGLWKTSHFHSHDNSVSVKFPDTIKVHEHKAPTDESIRLLEEMHDKAMDNIISKVKVDDNLVKGEVFLIEQPWNIKDMKIIIKFSINNQAFTIEKEISRYDWWHDNELKDTLRCMEKLESEAKRVMLWYCLKKFVGIAYEQITQTKLPDNFIK